MEKTLLLLSLFIAISSCGSDDDTPPTSEPLNLDYKF